MLDLRSPVNSIRLHQKYWCSSMWCLAIRVIPNQDYEKLQKCFTQLCIKPTGFLVCFCFFLKFGGHMWTHRAPDTPILDFWRCVLWISYPEWAALLALDRGVCDVHYLRFTSGTTPTELLTASMVASHCSPYACFSRGRMLDLNGRPPTQQTDMPTTQPPATGCLVLKLSISKMVKYDPLDPTQGQK